MTCPIETIRAGLTPTVADIEAASEVAQEYALTHLGHASLEAMTSAVITKAAHDAAEWWVDQAIDAATWQKTVGRLEHEAQEGDYDVANRALGRKLKGNEDLEFIEATEAAYRQIVIDRGWARSCDADDFLEAIAKGLEAPEWEHWSGAGVFEWWDIDDAWIVADSEFSNHGLLIRRIEGVWHGYIEEEWEPVSADRVRSAIEDAIERALD